MTIARPTLLCALIASAAALVLAAPAGAAAPLSATDRQQINAAVDTFVNHAVRRSNVGASYARRHPEHARRDDAEAVVARLASRLPVPGPRPAPPVDGPVPERKRARARDHPGASAQEQAGAGAVHDDAQAHRRPVARRRLPARGHVRARGRGAEGHGAAGLHAGRPGRGRGGSRAQAAQRRLHLHPVRRHRARPGRRRGVDRHIRRPRPADGGVRTEGAFRPFRHAAPNDASSSSAGSPTGSRRSSTRR